MKKFIAVLFLITFFLEWSFLPMLSAKFFPNLQFLAVFFMVIFLKRGFLENLIWLVVFGIFLALSSFQNFGAIIFSFLFFLVLFDVFKRKVLSENPSLISLFAIFFLGCATLEAVRFFLFFIFELFRVVSFESFHFSFSFSSYFISKILAAFFGILIYKIVHRIQALVERRQIEIKV